MAKLMMQMYGHTVTIDIDHDDVTADEMLEAFRGAMIAQSFLPETVDQAIKDYAEET